MNKNDSKIIEGHEVATDTVQWIEVGMQILKESISVGREYSKFMLGFTFSAIPIYLGLYKYVKESMMQSMQIEQLIIFFLPVLLCLVSSVLFLFAYYPKNVKFIISAIEDIKRAHQIIIVRRQLFCFAATLLFLLAVISAVLILAIK